MQINLSYAYKSYLHRKLVSRNESLHKCVTGNIKAVNPDTGEYYPMSYYAYDGPCEGMHPKDWSQLKHN